MRLEWDKIGERYYETGVRMAVLYPQATSGAYDNGEAWNGLTGVTEKPTGAEATKMYANDGHYITMMSAEEFEATVTAYTYPDSFAACDGSAQIAKGVYATQQERKAFGLSYRNAVGNDTVGTEFGYKLHLVYGAKVSPSEKANKTVNDSPEATEFSWELKTTPVSMAGGKPTAHLVIDSREADPTKLAALEKILYGDEDTEARLPLPSEVVTLMGEAVSGE